jgi:hypothetical protein
MLGEMAQLEVGKLSSAVSEHVLRGEEFSESSTNNLDGPHSTYPLDEVIMTPAAPLATHNNTTQGEKNNVGGDSINDDNDSSVSFIDEFRRHNKGIKQEVKFVVNPLFTKVRKLLKRTSNNATLKRSDGCLT